MALTRSPRTPGAEAAFWNTNAILGGATTVLGVAGNFVSATLDVSGFNALGVAFDHNQAAGSTTKMEVGVVDPETQVELATGLRVIVFAATAGTGANVGRFAAVNPFVVTFPYYMLVLIWTAAGAAGSTIGNARVWATRQ